MLSNGITLVLILKDGKNLKDSSIASSLREKQLWQKNIHSAISLAIFYNKMAI